MSESMIERVARVLANNAGDGRDYTDVARAAIEAMREPTDAMVDAGADACHTSGDACTIWNDMIDAALSEQVAG